MRVLSFLKGCVPKVLIDESLVFVQVTHKVSVGSLAQISALRRKLSFLQFDFLIFH